MPNPKPIQTEEFKRKRYHAIGEVDSPLSNKVTGVKLPTDVTEILNSWPQEERVIFLRSLITNAVREKVKKAS